MLFLIYNYGMERYKLQELYNSFTQFSSMLKTTLKANQKPFYTMLMGISLENIDTLSSFIGSAVYGYFYNDLVAYKGEELNDVREVFIDRLCYDIAVKFPYWYKKYNYIKKLLTTEDLSLLQSSKMTSSSSDETDSASGSLQKVATTPTGVSATGATDSIKIDKNAQDTKKTEITTDGFVDKYANTQQKYASVNNVKGTREGTILREGSIDELLNVLEKLPSSFADEITKELGKHFIFDYEGEERGYYDE